MVAKEYNEEDDFKNHFTVEDIKLFEERTAKRRSGESKTHTWKDAGFVAEMDRRMAELESGEVNGYTWDEVKQRAKDPLKSK